MSAPAKFFYVQHVDPETDSPTLFPVMTYGNDPFSRASNLLNAPDRLAWETPSEVANDS